jgi:hypothetical protein
MRGFRVWDAGAYRRKVEGMQAGTAAGQEGSLTSHPSFETNLKAILFHQLAATEPSIPATLTVEFDL